MSIPVTISLANPDPNAAPTTFQAAVNLLRTLFSASTPDSVVPYLLGSATPGVDDQDKVWHRTDGAGRPLGTYIYYNGSWVLEPPSAGARLGLFAGNPTTFFDGTGLGLINTIYYGWALANGMNGTANLSNQFIVLGGMDNAGITGFSGGLWRTNIEGGPHTQGGHTTQTLTDATTYRPARAAAGTVDIWMADGNTRDSGGDLYGVPAAGGDRTLLPADAGNTSPTPFSIIPPYYAMALIAWVGYP